MNGDTIADLKQFITAAISQQTSDIRGDIRDIRGEVSQIHGEIQRLDQKIDELSMSVGEALDTSNTVVGDQLKDHEQRIARLEQRAA